MKNSNLKTLLFALFVVLLVTGYNHNIYAQTPLDMTYQAVVRDGNQKLISNSQVGVKISIIKDKVTGAVVFEETHQPNSNDNGLVSLIIGSGTIVSGDISNINWGNGKYFIQIDMDPDGGTNYTVSGVNQILSVPYALFAKDVENKDDADADPVNEIQNLEFQNDMLSITSGNTVNLEDYKQELTFDNATGRLTITGGNTIVLPNSSNGDNWGTQIVQTNGTLDGDGTTAKPLVVVGDLTDDQNLSINGNDLSIDNGNTVTLPSGDDWGNQTVESDNTINGDGTTANPLIVNGDLTDDQNLTLNGNDLTIDNGNTVTLPSGDDWGNQKIVSNVSLDGDGTAASPLAVTGDLTDDQNLTLNGNTLSIENGNAVDLATLGSKWVNDGQSTDIYYDKGSADVRNNLSSMKIYPDSLVGNNSNQDKVKLNHESLDFSYTNTGSFSKGHYSRDSLYLYSQVGLLYPETAMLHPYSLKFLYNFKKSEMNSHKFSISDLQIGSPIERVEIISDSISLRTEDGTTTSKLSNDREHGGRLNLYDSTGVSLVEIGNNPFRDLLGLPSSGYIQLMDTSENVKYMAGSIQGSGFQIIDSDSTYINSQDGVTSVGFYETHGNLKFLKERATLGARRDGGFIDIKGSSDRPGSIIELKADDFNFQHTTGRLNMYQELDFYPSVELAVDEDQGGSLRLFGTDDGPLGFYAAVGGSGGTTAISDSNGLDRAGMYINHIFEPVVFVNEGKFIALDDLNVKKMELNQSEIAFYNSSNTLLSSFGRDYSVDDYGQLTLYGDDGNKNVHVGVEGSSRVGKISVYDDSNQENAYINGYGTVNGQLFSIREPGSTVSILAGMYGPDLTGYIELADNTGKKKVIIDGNTNGKSGNILVLDNNEMTKAGLFVDEITGQGHMFADVKNFRMKYPGKPGKEIWYAAVEGPEAGAYSRGVGTLKNGEAFIPFTEHFKTVVNHRTATVQLTPKHWDTYGLAVVKVTEDGFYVKELKGEKGNFDFDYEVKAVRKGYEDYNPVKTSEFIDNVDGTDRRNETMKKNYEIKE